MARESIDALESPAHLSAETATKCFLTLAFLCDFWISPSVCNPIKPWKFSVWLSCYSVCALWKKPFTQNLPEFTLLRLNVKARLVPAPDLLYLWGLSNSMHPVRPIPAPLAPLPLATTSAASLQTAFWPISWTASSSLYLNFHVAGTLRLLLLWKGIRRAPCSSTTSAVLLVRE